MNTQSYDFPVSLQPMFTKEGAEVPHMRAVVRGDNSKPIAAVSDRYHLIEHKTIVNKAEAFVKEFGEPKRDFSIGRDGAVFIGEYTYKEQFIEVAKGDLVGLRVYIDSSYTARSRLRVNIGGLVLTCLNGMVVPRDTFNFSYHHSSEHDIVFPKAEEVLQVFSSQGRLWNRYAEIGLTGAEYEDAFNFAVKDGIVQSTADASVPKHPTAWGLYNAFTYHVTHNSKASKLGKLNRLNKIGNWFETHFK